LKQPHAIATVLDTAGLDSRLIYPNSTKQAYAAILLIFSIFMKIHKIFIELFSKKMDIMSLNSFMKIHKKNYEFL